MKLPDFSLDTQLNDLRAKVGAPLRNYEPPSAQDTLSPGEIEILASAGLDIPLNDISILDDGTLVYKNRRVVLYIRDVKQYRQSEPNDLPRFHVANCDKLQEMRANNRFERYVVATRDSGLFQINLKTHNASSFRKSDEPLRVCQFCLSHLNWNSFKQARRSRTERHTAVAGFQLSDFFSVYPKSAISSEPKHDAISAPLNDYGPEFKIVADRIKLARGYRCDQCGVDLSHNKRFLHAHHRNGLQFDNADSNIVLLCIADHAEQYNHGHVKGTQDYKEYMRQFASIAPQTSRRR